MTRKDLVSARSMIRDAIAAIEQQEPDGNPSQTLIDRRWTIVDHHERDGRHYLVVVGDRATGIELLSPRELQVLAAAAAGQTTKVIAFELGLSDSTVRVLLARTAKKLGVKKRADMVALYRAHTGA